MPTYEYECSQCGKTFEIFQKMTAAPLSDCPDAACGAKGTLRRLIGPGSGVIFKGSGFYATDYKRNGGAGTAKAEEKGKSDGAPACNCPAAGSGDCPMKK